MMVSTFRGATIADWTNFLLRPVAPGLALTRQPVKVIYTGHKTKTGP